MRWLSQSSKIEHSTVEAFSEFFPSPLELIYLPCILKSPHQVKSAPALESNSPPVGKEKNKKCSSLEYESSMEARKKCQEENRKEKTSQKQQCLEGASTEKKGFFEKLVKSDSCESSSRKIARKIGIFKEKCLEMPDDSPDLVSTVSNPEQSDFLGGRRGGVKQKKVKMND